MASSSERAATAAAVRDLDLARRQAGVADSDHRMLPFCADADGNRVRRAGLLFDVTLSGANQPNYDVSADGQKFFVSSGGMRVSRLMVMTNMLPEVP